jgi:DNA repair exonuclease SbcCD nuclease subunit
MHVKIPPQAKASGFLLTEDRDKMRFLHTADWHIGSPQHPQLYKDGMLNAFDGLLNELNVDLVVCVGDVFDTHNPDQRVKDQLLRFLLNNNTSNFYFVVGNHDYIDKTRSYHSLEYLKILSEKLDNTTVIDETSVITIYPSRRGIPGIKLLSIIDPDWEQVEKTTSEEKIDIAAWHGTVPGISFDKGFKYSDDGKIDTFIKKIGCKYFALGDIHKHIQLHKRCWYPGALVQKTFGCESGLVLVEIEKDKISTTSVKLNLPEKKTINLSFDPGKDTEDSLIAFIKENIQEKSLVKLVFNLPNASWADVNKDKIKEEFKDYLSEIKLENNPIQIQNTRISSESIKKASSIEEELKIIIEDSDELELDKETLYGYCLDNL